MQTFVCLTIMSHEFQTIPLFFSQTDSTEYQLGRESELRFEVDNNVTVEIEVSTVISFHVSCVLKSIKTCLMESIDSPKPTSSLQGISLMIPLLSQL